MSHYTPGFVFRLLIPLTAYLCWMGHLFNWLVWHVGPFAIPVTIAAGFLSIVVGSIAAEDYVDRKVDEEFSRLFDTVDRNTTE